MKPRVAFFLALYFCLAILSGCGSDSSSLVVSSTPQNGARGVTPMSPVEVTVSKDLDPTSVNGSTVTLSGRDDFTGRPIRVTGEVNYISSSRTITFTPGGMDSYNDSSSCVLKLAGLKDAAGNPLPEAVISFSTGKMFSKLQGHNLDPPGLTYEDVTPVGSYYRMQFDASGNPSRQIFYSGAGPDGVWFTNDDSIAAYLEFTFDPSAKTIRNVYHRSPGTDGVWFTANDPVDYYSIYSYGGDKDITVFYNGAGADGKLFSADDSVDFYWVATYNSDGSMSSQVGYGSPGADGRWFTNDDRYSHYYTFLYDANGNLIRQAQSYGAGLDGIPFTADDRQGPVTPDVANGSAVNPLPTVSYMAINYDANNRQLSRAIYTDPGPDRTWFTPDDVYDIYSTFLYNGEGRLIRRAQSPGAGTDGIPFTADDSRTGMPGLGVWYESLSYDGRGNLVKTIGFSDPGADGTWFTADDMINSYEAITLNGAGKELQSVWFFGPGPDGVWFTADDRVSHYSDSSYDSSGRMVQKLYFHFGQDRVGFTADDELYSYYTFTYDAKGRTSEEREYSKPGPDGVWFSADDVLNYRVEIAYFP